MMNRRVIALFMVVILLTFSSCSFWSHQDDTTEVPSPTVTTIPNDKTSQQVAFDVFTDDIFIEQVQNDSITLNYTLANPENYGIKDYTPTFGEYSIESMEQNFSEDKSYLQSLEKFNYDLLSEDQQITYDILYELFTDSLQFEDYMLYDEVLSSTTGLQAQLPVLLAEYNIQDKDDVTDYLSLLATMDSYFNQICEFEIEKSRAGLFMSDTSADDIIDQCNQFISNPEDNLLIQIFDSKIAALDYNEVERAALVTENKNAVTDHVIPAYEHLIDTLTSLKGTGKNDGGLCNYEHGKDYYSLLLGSQTGSAKTVEETKQALEDELYASILSMQDIVKKDSDALSKVEQAKYKLTDPKEILSFLKEEISKDFPSVKSVNCSIKYVDKSLEDHMSPAFYLTPPIDCYTDNCVYINGSDKYDLSDIFTTIAHEGYPGHLYQNVYYASQNPSLIRNIISFGGYSEGWATYVELYSYDLAGLGEEVADLLKLNNISILCIYGLCDIGVNYSGWTKEELLTFLNSLGLGNEEVAAQMYQAVIDEPCNYLKYTLGYLEMKELKEKAENALGDGFTLKDFHEFVLSFGPAQYDILNKYLDQWIVEKTAAN